MSLPKPIGLLVRHGHDTLSDSGTFVSWTDAPLSPQGEEEAHETIEKLKEYDIQLVYSSPLQRCVAMAEMLGDEFTQSRDLLPWNRGILTGVLESEGEDTLQLFIDNPKVRIPLGESRIECENRLWKFFKPALEHSEDELTVFFTHHSVIDTLNALVTGERIRKNLVKPGGIVAVYADGEDYRLEPIWNADETQGPMS